MDTMKKQKYMTLENEFPDQKVSNILLVKSREKLLILPERMKSNPLLSGSKHKDIQGISGGENKVKCCKEQYCIGTWNSRYMDQGNLDVVEKETVSLKSAS